VTTGACFRTLAASLCLAAGAAVVGGWPVGAAGRTVWDGVYTAAQADRGKAVYAQQCSGCHGDFLDGDGANERVVGLSGVTFADNWESTSVYDLFIKIAKTMPRSAAGSLASRDVLDLVAFLLQYNGFPAGVPLADTPDLALIDIVDKEGPRPLRPGAGVRAVGCLTQTGDTWTLTRAAAPVRTKNPAVSVAADLVRARTMALGSRTIAITSVKAGPDVRPGVKAEVKGVFSSGGAGDGIAVMSLQVVAPACE
jgi:hypothetical protein